MKHERLGLFVGRMWWQRDRWFLLALVFVALNGIWVLRELGRRASDPCESAASQAPLFTADVTDFDENRQVVLSLHFNREPAWGELTHWLRITDAKKHQVGWSRVQPPRDGVIQLLTDSLGTPTFTVTLQAGMPFADAGGVVAKSHSIALELPDELTVGRIEAVSYAGSGRIYIHTTTPVAADTFAAFVRLTPPVDVSATAFERWRGSGIQLDGAFEPGCAYRVDLLQGLPAANGGQLAKPLHRTVSMPDLDPSLDFPARGRYLSAKGTRRLALKTVNLARVQLRSERVHENNIVFFAMRENNRYRHFYGHWDDNSYEGLTESCGEIELQPVAGPNTVGKSVVDMGQLMGSRTHGVFRLEAEGFDEGGERPCVRESRMVAVSDLGVTARRGRDGVHVWVNSLMTATAVPGATVILFSTANQQLAQGKTDSDGVCHLIGAFNEGESQPFLVTVRAGTDMTYHVFDQGRVSYAEGSGGESYSDAAEAYLYTDRGVYRPGETMRVRAILRDSAMEAPEAHPVELIVTRPDGRTVFEQVQMLSALGTATFDVGVRESSPTGKYRLVLRLPGDPTDVGQCTRLVEMFIPPRIRVDVDPLFDPDRRIIRAGVTSRFLYGQVASGLPASMTVGFVSRAFAPAAWHDFAFGDCTRSYAQQTVKSPMDRLGEQGYVDLSCPLPSGTLPPGDLTAIVSATVTENSGRSVTARGGVRVPMYERYLGIRLPEGSGIGKSKVELCVLDAEGSPVLPDGPVRVRLLRIDWVRTVTTDDDGNESISYHEQQTECSVVDCRPGKSGTSNVVVGIPQPGRYQLEAVSDGAASVVTQFYSGEHVEELGASPPTVVALTPDKPSYRPGEQMALTLEAPFAGHVLLSFEAGYVLTQRVCSVGQGTTMLDLEVPADVQVANIYLTASLVRPLVASDDPDAREADVVRATGLCRVDVREPACSLDVQLICDDHIRPRTQLRPVIEVRDASGTPVTNAEVTVAAVDEGICMITSFRSPDPMAFFARPRRLGVSLSDVYGWLMPEFSSTLLAQLSETGGGAGLFLGGKLSPVRGRRYEPTVLWSGVLTTDSEGRATPLLPIPEFTGNLRLMAVAVGPRAVGGATRSVTVARPLVVDTSLPRFAAPGDHFEMPMELRSTLAASATAQVTVVVSSPLQAAITGTNCVVVPGVATRLEIPVDVLDTCGLGHVRITVEGGGEHYEEQFELPIRPPSPEIVESGVLMVASGTTERVDLPSEWFAGTAHRSVRLSSQPILQVGGTLQSLVRYPYGCLEQTTSRSFPMLEMPQLAGVLPDGELDIDGARQLARAGMWRMLSMQRADGGFGWWQGDPNVWPWGTVYATHFLVRASELGLPVPAASLDAALGFLDKRLASANTFESERKNIQELGLRAYAARVLAAAGRPPRQWLARGFELRDALDTPGRIHLAVALSLAGEGRRATSLIGELELANAMAIPRDEGGQLDSPIRTVAMYLDALLRILPDSAVQHQAAAWLCNQLSSQQWLSTQDAAWAVRALGAYYAQHPPVPYSGSAQLQWRRRAGGAVVRRLMQSPFSGELSLPDDAGGPLSVKNAGNGLLLAAWTARGVPTQMPAAHARGMVLTRRYLVDGREVAPSDVLTQGQLVVVELKLAAKSLTRRNVVMCDLLPAGLEVENGRLDTMAHLPLELRDSVVPTHVDVRDDRVITFSRNVPRISKPYRYLARCVTPGTFVVPPATAECMYAPAVSACTGSSTLTIRRGP